MIRQAFAALLILCVLSCSTSVREPVIGEDLLIDISIYEPMRGNYDRYTLTYTPGDSSGRLVRNRRSGVTILRAQDVRWLAELTETELLTLEANDGHGCLDCLEVEVFVRLGSRSRAARIVAGTHPPAIQKLLDRFANRG
jgi:hypothetical protein